MRWVAFGPERTSLTGEWAGLTNGVRIQLNVVESTQADPVFGQFQSVAGTGSLTILATGELLLFTATGFHQSGPTGVLINFEAPDAAPNEKWYGHFWGQLNSAGALAGAIDGSVQNTIGPFQGGTFADKPVTLTRQ